MNEGAKWRKFLHPLVGALALLIAAATAAIQKGNSENADARFTALEIKTEALAEQHKSYNADLSIMREALSVIRSDVAFIRGTMAGATGK